MFMVIIHKIFNVHKDDRKQSRQETEDIRKYTPTEQEHFNKNLWKRKLFPDIFNKSQMYSFHIILCTSCDRTLRTITYWTVGIIQLVGIGRACAHPSFELIATQNGTLRAPPLPIAASLLLIRPSKIYKIYWAAHVKGFFLSTGSQRLWNMRSPAPRSAHRSFAFSLPVRTYAILFFGFSFL